MKDAGKLKQIHLAMIIAGFILPLISVLVCHWAGGFGISVVWNYSCVPRNNLATVYSVFIPVLICSTIGTVLLLFIGSQFVIDVSTLIIICHRNYFNQNPLKYK